MGNVPTHEEIKKDYNISFNGNLMTHLPNKIDGKPSGYYLLREILIKIITNSNFKNMDDLLELNDELFLELHNMVNELNLKFEFSWNKNDIEKNPFYNYKIYPTNDESKEKWLIEKDYLFYWFNKAKNNELDITTEKCVLNILYTDKSWITEGERIATLYCKAHLNK